MTGLESGDDLSVLFERGDKSTSTSPKTMASGKNGNLTTTFSEILRLDATLYKDSHGVYQEKVGKLTVRLKKTGAAGLKTGKDSYKAIGVIPLQLHNYVNSTEAHQQLNLPLMWCMADSAVLTVTISTRISDSAQNSEADSDDNSSVASTGTKGSSVSAANRPPGAAASRLTATANSKPVVPPIQSKLAPTAPVSTQPGRASSISGTSTAGASHSTAATTSASEETSSVSWSSRKGSKNTTSASTSKPPSVPPSDDGSEDGPRPSTGSFKTNVGTKGASFTVDDWQPDFNGSEISAQDNPTTKRIDNGSDMGQQEDEDEDEDKVNDSTKSRYPVTNAMKGNNKKMSMGNNLSRDASPLRNNILSTIAPVRNNNNVSDDDEIERLKEEIDDLKDQNMKLKSKSAATSIITSSTTHTGSGNNNETEVLKNKIENLNQKLKESEKSMQEMKYERDEKINENAKLLKELLDIKMNAVPNAKDTEYWKMCCTELKLNLQSYASRLTAMEVQLAEAEVNYADTSLSSPTSRPSATTTPIIAPIFARPSPTSTSTSIQPPAMKAPQRPFQVPQSQPQSQSQSKPATQSPGYPSTNYSSNHQEAQQYSAPQHTQNTQSHQSTSRTSHSSDRDRDRDLDMDPYGAPSLPSSSSNTASKLSNFINSTKPLPGGKAPDSEHYGRKSPLNNYSGSVDLS